MSWVLTTAAAGRAPQVKFFHNGQHPVYMTGHLSEDEDIPMDPDR